MLVRVYSTNHGKSEHLAYYPPDTDTIYFHDTQTRMHACHLKVTVLALSNISKQSASSFLMWYNAHGQLQDLVVGYMGVPKYGGISMTQHPQYVTVR